MAISQAGEGVWGLHVWTSDKTWGWHNTQTGSGTVDRMDGSAFWGNGYWVEDFWFTW